MAIVDQSQGQVSGKKEQKKGGESQTCLGTAIFGQSNAARLTALQCKLKLTENALQKQSESCWKAEMLNFNNNLILTHSSKNFLQLCDKGKGMQSIKPSH